MEGWQDFAFSAATEASREGVVHVDALASVAGAHHVADGPGYSTRRFQGMSVNMRLKYPLTLCRRQPGLSPSVLLGIRARFTPRHTPFHPLGEGRVSKCGCWNTGSVFWREAAALRAQPAGSTDKSNCPWATGWQSTSGSGWFASEASCARRLSINLENCWRPASLSRAIAFSPSSRSTRNEPDGIDRSRMLNAHLARA